MSNGGQFTVVTIIRRLEFNDLTSIDADAFSGLGSLGAL